MEKDSLKERDARKYPGASVDNYNDSVQAATRAQNINPRSSDGAR